MLDFVKNVGVVPDNSMQQDALLDLLIDSLEMKTHAIGGTG